MTTTFATARQDLADLEARMLAGDDTVTIAQLAKARDAAEWADMKERADALAAEQAVAVQREIDAEEARTRLTKAMAACADELPALYAAAVKANAALRAGLERYVAQYGDASGTLARYGVSELVTYEYVEVDIARTLKAAAEATPGQPAPTWSNAQTAAAARPIADQLLALGYLGFDFTPRPELTYDFTNELIAHGIPVPTDPVLWKAYAIYKAEAPEPEAITDDEMSSTEANDV